MQTGCWVGEIYQQHNCWSSPVEKPERMVQKKQLRSIWTIVNWKQ